MGSAREGVRFSHELIAFSIPAGAQIVFKIYSEPCPKSYSEKLNLVLNSALLLIYFFKIQFTRISARIILLYYLDGVQYKKC